MALVLADRVQETTTSTGTGTITLAGAATGYQSFSTAIGNGNTTYYTISGGSEWEVGIGTYTSAGNTLSRDTVLSSSAGGTTKVTFSAGTKNVFVTYPAEKSVNQDASGNVGIGTSAPAGKLDVTGSSGSVVVNAAGEQIAYTYNGFNYLTASGAAATLQIQASGASGKLIFATAGSERMRITSAGNVGIGTNAPSGALDVVRSAADSVINVTSGSNTLQIFENTAGDAYLTNYTSGKSIRFSQAGAGFINFGVNGSERMRITSAGDVGIGTTPSGARLDVSGLIRSRTSTAYIDVNHDGTNGSLLSTSSLLMYAGGANPMILHTNGSERMRIDSAGNVGIGTSSPGQKLTVAGTVESTSGGFKFPDGTTQTSAGVSQARATALSMILGF